MRNNLELMLIESAKISKNDICIIIGDEPKLFTSSNPVIRKFVKAIALMISHVNLGIKINKHKDKDAIIVYAFSTEFLLLSFLVSLRTKNVYLVNSHNIQQAYESPIMNWLLKLYHRLGYKFFVLETSAILMDLGYQEKDLARHVSLPHSVMSSENIDNNVELQISKKKKIGIIGESRQGKKFSRTLDLMLTISRKLDVVLAIGTNDFSCFDGMDLEGVELIDTSTNDAYMSALSACDAIVLNYEKSKYFYRCSGVAADAISVKTYVVCPDFPLMSSQVNYPAQVGVVYQDEQDLEIALRQALELTSNSDQSGFESHYRERSIIKAASIIDRAIQDNA